MNSIIISGIKVETRCKYVKFTEGSYLSIRENTKSSYLELIFRKGMRSTDIVDDRFIIISDKELETTGYLNVSRSPTLLNNLSLIKLVNHPYNYSQLIVNDLDDFIMDYDEYQCRILIPRSKIHDSKSLGELISRNPYLKCGLTNTGERLYNYYNILIRNKGTSVISSNDVDYNSKGYYEKYLLRPIDVQLEFITQLKTLLSNYGLDLKKLPLTGDNDRVNRILYKFTNIGSQVSRKISIYPDSDAIQQKFNVEFEGSFIDLVMLNDFKIKYQNLNFISNFTTFRTIDKLGRSWISNIVWDQLSSDFSQDFSQDSQGNSAFTCTFSAEVGHYVIYDQKYMSIQKIITEVIAKESFRNKSKL